jgi:hypothetical protein
MQQQCSIVANNIALGGIRIDAFDAPVARSDQDPRSIAERYLLSWYNKKDGRLVPWSTSSPVPDEAIVTMTDGRTGRFTIVDWMNARHAEAFS